VEKWGREHSNWKGGKELREPKGFKGQLPAGGGMLAMKRKCIRVAS